MKWPLWMRPAGSSRNQPLRTKRARVSTHPQTQTPVTWKQVTAFRMRRHHLAERSPVGTLISVAGDMAGAQAQLLSAAQISFWARVRDLRTEDVEEALKNRTLVKTACMRRTLFLVPAADVATFVRGSARRAEKEIRWARGKGVPERVLDTAIEATLGVLDQPLTRTEIAERVCHTLGVGMKTFSGGGWGNRRDLAAVPVGSLTYPVLDLLHLVGARGVVCYGPDRGGVPTFVRAEAWIPHWQDLPVEQAEELLLRRYLGAFGPATAADFAMWSGMTLTDARQVWGRQEAGIAPVQVEGWAAAILQEDLETLAQARFDSPAVRLLPYFDTYLLGHREREHVVSRQHQPKIYRPQGWISPVVLLDGRAAGVWTHARQGNRLSVRVTPFEPITVRVAAGIREEAQDLGRFLGIKNVDVRID